MSKRNPKSFQEMEQYLARRNVGSVEARLRLVKDGNKWGNRRRSNSIPTIYYRIDCCNGYDVLIEIGLNEYKCDMEKKNGSLVEYDLTRGKLYELAKIDFGNHIERLKTMDRDVESIVEEAYLPNLESAS